MHPETAAVRVAEAHEYIAGFVAEHGEGDFADRVRKMRGQALSPPAREVRDAEAMAALAEILQAWMNSPRKTPTRKGK
jgi:hypothetical protein